MQIIAEAAIPSITAEDVWDHFVNVTVPVIQKYQVEFPVQRESTLSQMLVHFAEAMQTQQRNSEVSKCTVIERNTNVF